MADHDGQTRLRRKGRERLPVNLFGQDRPEGRLTRLMWTGHPKCSYV
jgi:hypothetical protein